MLRLYRHPCGQKEKPPAGGCRKTGPLTLETS